MTDTKKIAISLSGELFKKVERVRKSTGESRSAFIGRAVESALSGRERRRLVAEYEEGYRRRPETSDEVKAAEASAVKLLAGEPWE